MDAVLAKVKSAPSDDAECAALADAQKEVNDKVPFLVWGSQTTFVSWSETGAGNK